MGIGVEFGLGKYMCVFVIFMKIVMLKVKQNRTAHFTKEQSRRENKKTIIYFFRVINSLSIRSYQKRILGKYPFCQHKHTEKKN